MKVTKETLKKLAEDIEIEEAERKLSEQINITFSIPEVSYYDGNFILSFRSTADNTLSGFPNICRNFEVLNNFKLSKEDSKEIRELIITKFRKRVEENLSKSKMILKDEIITI